MLGCASRFKYDKTLILLYLKYIFRIPDHLVCGKIYNCKQDGCLILQFITNGEHKKLKRRDYINYFLFPKILYRNNLSGQVSKFSHITTLVCSFRIFVCLLAKGYHVEWTRNTFSCAAPLRAIPSTKLALIDFFISLVTCPTNSL